MYGRWFPSFWRGPWACFPELGTRPRIREERYVCILRPNANYPELSHMTQLCFFLPQANFPVGPSILLKVYLCLSSPSRRILHIHIFAISTFLAQYHTQYYSDFKDMKYYCNLIRLSVCVNTENISPPVQTSHSPLKLVYSLAISTQASLPRGGERVNVFS